MARFDFIARTRFDKSKNQPVRRASLTLSDYGAPRHYLNQSRAHS
jgi:hypothetical protein